MNRHIAALLAALILLPATAPAATLIARWEFDGNYATANHNTPYDLTPGGGVTLVPSPRGMAAEFHGGKYPIIPPTFANPALDRLDTTAMPNNVSFNGGFSVMCWITIKTNFNAILSHDSSSYGPNNRGFQFSTTSTLVLGLRDSTPAGGSSAAFADGSPFTTNHWYHVAATWDGTAADGFALYINGQPVPYHIQSLAPFQGLNDVNPLPIRIGANLGDSAQNAFATHGAIDHLSFYSGAITAAEVQADYLATLVPKLNIRVSQVELCWDTDADQVYQLQYRSDLTTNMWSPMSGLIPGTGLPFCTNDTVFPGQPQKFYQLSLSLTNAP